MACAIKASDAITTPTAGLKARASAAAPPYPSIATGWAVGAGCEELGHADRGSRQLKGVIGDWQLFEVVPG
jgi:hypothetical protein